MRSKKTTSKINFYFTLLELFKKNKTTAEISKILSISKQKLYYYTTDLKKLGFIQKKGYGVWEILRSKKPDLEHAIKWRNKQIRGHAFIWRVKLNNKFNWIEVLNNKKIPYKLVRGYTPRIFIKNNKVWLGKETIVIYDSKSFFGKNAIESRKYAVFEFLTILKALSKELGVSLGKTYFKPTREHYGLIKNELAQQCNKKGEKIVIHDDLDGEWLWIDDSTGQLGELETGGKGFTKDRAGLNLEVQKWWNNHKETDFKVTPTFLLESLNKLTQSQLIEQTNKLEYSKDLIAHKEAIKQMGFNTEANTKSIELLADTILELKELIERNGNK